VSDERLLRGPEIEALRGWRGDCSLRRLALGIALGELDDDSSVAAGDVLAAAERRSDLLCELAALTTEGADAQRAAEMGALHHWLEATTQRARAVP
jgi:hypothetical protein